MIYLRKNPLVRLSGHDSIVHVKSFQPFLAISVHEQSAHSSTSHKKGVILGVALKDERPSFWVTSRHGLAIGKAPFFKPENPGPKLSTGTFLGIPLETALDFTTPQTGDRVPPLVRYAARLKFAKAVTEDPQAWQEA